MNLATAEKLCGGESRSQYYKLYQATIEGETYIMKRGTSFSGEYSSIFKIQKGKAETVTTYSELWRSLKDNSGWKRITAKDDRAEIAEQTEPEQPFYVRKSEGGHWWAVCRKPAKKEALDFDVIVVASVIKSKKMAMFIAAKCNENEKLNPKPKRRK